MNQKEWEEEIMELQRVEAAIEAILFTMGDSVELRKIAEAIEQDEETTKKIIHHLMDKYASENRGITIIELEGSFQMCTRNEYYEYLIRVTKAERNYVLTDVVLETLSIIAYKQPVTKLEMEKIRGVNCDHTVSRLIELGLVCDIGRLDAPGRPLLFGTTEEFLRSFGVKSLEELPEADREKIEEFKTEAEEEIQLSLDI